MIKQLLKSKEEFEAWLKLWRPVFYKSKVILEADKEELVKEFTEQQLALIQEIKKMIEEQKRNYKDCRGTVYVEIMEIYNKFLKELDNIKK